MNKLISSSMNEQIINLFAQYNCDYKSVSQDIFGKNGNNGIIYSFESKGNTNLVIISSVGGKTMATITLPHKINYYIQEGFSEEQIEKDLPIYSAPTSDEKLFCSYLKNII